MTPAALLEHDDSVVSFTESFTSKEVILPIAAESTVKSIVKNDTKFSSLK